MTGGGRQGLKGSVQVSMAETGMCQLDKPGKAAKVVGRLTEAPKEADEVTRCPFLPENPFPGERRANQGPVAGTTRVGW